MNYNHNGKTIYISDSVLEKNMKILNISKDEAVQMWLEDEGYLENNTVKELTEKAKVNKVKHGARASVSNKSKPRERKPDVEKENLIILLAKALENENILVNITNKSKIIEFSVGENHYKLDLIKQRPPKK